MLLFGIVRKNVLKMLQ